MNGDRNREALPLQIRLADDQADHRPIDPQVDGGLVDVTPQVHGALCDPVALQTIQFTYKLTPFPRIDSLLATAMILSYFGYTPQCRHLM